MRKWDHKGGGMCFRWVIDHDWTRQGDDDQSVVVVDIDTHVMREAMSNTLWTSTRSTQSYRLDDSQGSNTINSTTHLLVDGKGDEVISSQMWASDAAGIFCCGGEGQREGNTGTQSVCVVSSTVDLVSVVTSLRVLWSLPQCWRWQ